MYIYIQCTVTQFNGIDLLPMKQTLESIHTHTNDLNFLRCIKIMNESAIFIVHRTQHTYEVLTKNKGFCLLFTSNIDDYLKWNAGLRYVQQKILLITSEELLLILNHIKLKYLLIRNKVRLWRKFSLYFKNWIKCKHHSSVLLRIFIVSGHVEYLAKPKSCFICCWCFTFLFK